MIVGHVHCFPKQVGLEHTHECLILVFYNNNNHERYFWKVNVTNLTLLKKSAYSYFRERYYFYEDFHES